MKEYVKKWWKLLKYEPTDPRFDIGKSINIVVIGGGTGLSNLLRGLKNYSNSITAIVTMTDDGSSSGVIRKEFDILPPGDIRKCISALAYDEELISKIFEYRFSAKGSSISGHTLGNIWITALTDYFKSFEKAIEATSQVFQTAGQVLPVSLQRVNLCAQFDDGTTVEGESKFVLSGKKIKKVFLSKKGVKAYAPVLSAIKNADVIILGPGSLYTSVIPNLLISSIVSAICNNQKALKIYIANCSTERGETEEYTISDHIKAVNFHSKKRVFDYCLVNSRICKRSKLTSKLGEINNITTDENMIDNVKIMKRDIVLETNPLYHDSEKLAKEISRLYNKIK